MKRENISFLSNTKQSSQLQHFIPSNTIACNAAKHGGGGTEIIFLLPELRHDFSFGWGNFLSAPEHKSEQCCHAVIEIALCVTPTNCLPCLEPLFLCTVAQTGSVNVVAWDGRCGGAKGSQTGQVNLLSSSVLLLCVFFISCRAVI